MCCKGRPLMGFLLLALVVGATWAVARTPRSAVPTDQPQTRPALKALVWHDTLEKALADAQKSHRLVLVDVYADWCGWCHKLDADTLSKPDVQEKLREFALLKLDADNYGDVARRYEVQGLPTTLVLSEKGEMLANQPGYMTPEEYLKFLAEAAKKKST